MLLHPYSSNLNAIEKFWNSLKSKWKKYLVLILKRTLNKEDTIDGLVEILDGFD